MNKIIPSTKVRTQWRKLVKTLPKEQAFTVTRHYKAEAVVSNPEYFKKLERAYQLKELTSAMDAVSQEFKNSLRKRGINPDKLSEKKVMGLLGLE